MATQLGKAYVQIIPSARGISGGIAQAIDPEAKSAGISAGRSISSGIKDMIMKAGIGVAVTKTISSALNEGAALQQSIGGIETLFKDSADTMKQYASEAYKSCGLSANQYMEQATGFAASLISSTGGDTAKAADIANQALIDMSDNANKMGTDMGALQNAYQGFAKQNYTMLDNLKLGYGGTQAEMQRLLDDAQALSGVEYNIENLSDVYNAIHVIQENLDITGTTSKEAASTFTGSFAAMSSAAKNLLGNIAIGENISPSLQALMETTKTFVFGNFIPMLWNVVKAIPGAVFKMLQSTEKDIRDWASTLDFIEISRNISRAIFAIGEKAPGFIRVGAEIVGNLISGVSQGIPELIGFMADKMESLLFATARYAPQWISAGFDFVNRMITGFLSGVPEFINMAAETVNEFIGALMFEDWGAVGSDVVTSFIGGLSGLITDIGTVCAQIWETFSSVDWLGLGAELFQEIFEGISQTAPIVFEQISTVAGDLLSFFMTNLPQWIGAGVELLGNLALGIANGISLAVGAFSDMTAQVATWLRNFDWAGTGNALMTMVVEGLTNLAGLLPKVGEACMQIWTTITTTDWFGLGADVLWAIIEGIGDMLGEMWNVATQAADQLTNKMKEVDWPQVGKDVVNAIIEGIKSLLTNMFNAAGELFGKISEKMSSIDWGKVGSEVTETIATGLSSVLSAIGGAAAEIVSNLWNGIINTDWGQLGRDIIDGIVKGIGSVGNALWEGAKGAASGLFNGFKDFFGIHSPSRLMRDEIGKYIPAGIAVGIEANADQMTDAMKAAAQSTVEVGSEAVAHIRVDRSVSPASIAPALSASKETDAQSIIYKMEDVAERLEKAFQVVLSIDSKAFARATAPDMDKEFRRLAVAK